MSKRREKDDNFISVKFFDYRKVDEDLQSEYEAVVHTGLFETNFFDYNAWFDKERLKLVHKPEQLEDAVYRGWMMRTDIYRKFYQELFKQNIRLVTMPEEYEKRYIFPNIYKSFGEDTAGMDIFYKYKGNLLTGGICIKEYVIIDDDRAEYDEITEHNYFVDAKCGFSKADIAGVKKRVL